MVRKLRDAGFKVVPRSQGKGRPTQPRKCAKCGKLCPSAGEARDHCRVRRGDAPFRIEAPDRPNASEAAPELLFALEQILGDLPSKRDWMNPDIEKIARTAIQRAKGE